MQTYSQLIVGGNQLIDVYKHVFMKCKHISERTHTKISISEGRIGAFSFCIYSFLMYISNMNEQFCLKSNSFGLAKCLRM